jgi:hypothetical protein
VFNYDLNENELKDKLTEWFYSASPSIKRVRWETDHVDASEHTDDAFVTDGGGEQLDLVIEGEQLTFAVEVKRLASYGNVYEGVEQTIRYWDKYVRGDEGATYRAAELPEDADDSELDIDAFLLATNSSINARLYADWGEKENSLVGTDLPPERLRDRESYSEYRKCADEHELPYVEYNTTEASLRIMWRVAEYVSSKNERRAGGRSNTGIGFLLSSANDQNDDGNRPMAQFKTLQKIGDRTQHWVPIR